jgi:hypothetical protein
MPLMVRCADVVSNHGAAIWRPEVTVSAEAKGWDDSGGTGADCLPIQARSGRRLALQVPQWNLSIPQSVTPRLTLLRCASLVTPHGPRLPAVSTWSTPSDLICAAVRGRLEKTIARVTLHSTIHEMLKIAKDCLIADAPPPDEELGKVLVLMCGRLQAEWRFGGATLTLIHANNGVLGMV